MSRRSATAIPPCPRHDTAGLFPEEAEDHAPLRGLPDAACRGHKACFGPKLLWDNSGRKPKSGELGEAMGHRLRVWQRACRVVRRQREEVRGIEEGENTHRTVAGECHQPVR